MHTTTVRFPPSVWAELKAHAEADGVATAQVIREATIARLAVLQSRDAGPQHDDELAALRARVIRVERALDSLTHQRALQDAGG